ncbi:MAG: nucleotidyltransferase domain-containing protein [Elusimicrobia bacterium]|mgnify:CR=1 FL=1|jgi:predicted nucleotidyltransferase|nr:nucleotidyltransferase domain-containing protein [Elusimicrobiota bacterium]
MRISPPERRALNYALENIPFDAFLFGSRCDDTRRGGDVDVLVLGKDLTDAQRLDMELKIIARFQSLCDEKIDVAVFDITRLTPAEKSFLAVVGSNKLSWAA